MDNSDLVYVDVDVATITAATLGLGKDEGGMAESRINYPQYEGRHLRTNVHTPGALRRGHAWVSIRELDRGCAILKIVIQAQD